MMSLLLFIGTTLFLLIEGKLVIRLLSRGSLTSLEEWALGFPLIVFVNALVVFVLTVFSIPLYGVILYGIHAAILVYLFLRCKKLPHTSTPYSLLPTPLHTTWKQILVASLLISISVKLIYAFSHSVLLPSFYYDTISQWNMRAQISFVDHAIAFDANEIRGLSKPNYPILLHSLQILFMLPQRVWMDSVANGSTFLLSLSSIFALFLLLSRMRGSIFGLGSIAILLMIPLMSFHLSQGYGDVHVLCYILLSAVCFVLANEKRGEEIEEERKRGRFLMLSAVFVSAAAWAKQDGLFFGVVPWMFLLCVVLMMRGGMKKKKERRESYGDDSSLFFPSSLSSPLLCFALSVPWSLYLLFRGMGITPHGGSDFAFGFHADAVPAALKALFASGSFGVFWYVALIGLGLACLPAGRGFGFGWRRWRKCISELLIIAWGLLVFLEALVIYLWTPNVQFLLNQQTFSRTMLIPLCLLLLGLGMLMFRLYDLKVCERQKAV